MTRDEREAVREVVNGIMCIKKLLDRHTNKLLPEYNLYAFDLTAVTLDTQKEIDSSFVKSIAEGICNTTEKLQGELKKTDKYFELVHRLDKYLKTKEK